MKIFKIIFITFTLLQSNFNQAMEEDQNADNTLNNIFQEQESLHVFFQDLPNGLQEYIFNLLFTNIDPEDSTEVIQALKNYLNIQLIDKTIFSAIKNSSRIGHYLPIIPLIIMQDSTFLKKILLQCVCSETCSPIVKNIIEHCTIDNKVLEKCLTKAVKHNNITCMGQIANKSHYKDNFTLFLDTFKPKFSDESLKIFLSDFYLKNALNESKESLVFYLVNLFDLLKKHPSYMSCINYAIQTNRTHFIEGTQIIPIHTDCHCLTILKKHLLLFNSSDLLSAENIRKSLFNNSYKGLRNEIMEFLIAHNLLKIDDKDNNGLTLLMSIAKEEGHDAIQALFYLVKHTANLSIADLEGQTGLTYLKEFIAKEISFIENNKLGIHRYRAKSSLLLINNLPQSLII